MVPFFFGFHDKEKKQHEKPKQTFFYKLLFHFLTYFLQKVNTKIQFSYLIPNSVVWFVNRLEIPFLRSTGQSDIKTLLAAL